MTEGFYHKYDVARVEEGNKESEVHKDCDFFVLDLTHDVYAVSALAQYRKSIIDVDPKLWSDLTMLLMRYCNCIDMRKPSVHCPIHMGGL